MVQPVREPRSYLSYLGLLIWLAVFAAIILAAIYWKDKCYFSPWVTTQKPSSSKALNLREVLYIGAPVSTFLFTVAMHFVDRRWLGGGIAQRARETRELHKLEPDVISGTMTKLSVLAALASIFIVFLQQLPQNPTDYYIVVRWISSAGFLISIVLMLVSVKTYDYSNRFKWENHPYHGGATGDPYYRVNLSQKAFGLDIASFYFLIFTAILSTGLIVTWFPIPASMLCGVLLWITYFFPSKRPDALASMQPYSITFAAIETGQIKSWYMEKLNFTEVNSSKISKNGFFVETIKVETTPPQHVARISFRVHDVDSVAKKLKEKSAAVVTDVTTDTASGDKEFVVRDATGTMVRFIQTKV